MYTYRSNRVDRKAASSRAFVYFIQQGHDGPVKIGVASDPAGRLAQLQTGNPIKLRIVGFFPGRDDYPAPEIEADLHADLAVARLSGEWFAPHPLVREWLDAVAAVDGHAILAEQRRRAAERRDRHRVATRSRTGDPEFERLKAAVIA